MMATSFSTTPAGHLKLFEDRLGYANFPQQQSSPLSIRSQGRYGSRSVERSLQHPQGGFHNPLKSLSPLAARFIQEIDEDSDGEINDLKLLPIAPPTEREFGAPSSNARASTVLASARVGEKLRTTLIDPKHETNVSKYFQLRRR